MVPDRFEMRAQIWKQIEPSTEDDKYRYTLLWEHRVTGTVASENGILWRVSGLSFFAAHMWLNGKITFSTQNFQISDDSTITRLCLISNMEGFKIVHY